MSLDDIVAVDMHTHATVSLRNPPDEVTMAFDKAMAEYFKEKLPRLTIAGPRSTTVNAR
jgi:hypothetical protein